MVRPAAATLASAATLAIGIVAWALLLYYTPMGFRLPLVGHYVEASHFSRLAHGLQPGSIQSKRFAVIADALMHNRTTYSFTSNIGPGAAK